MNRFSMTGWSVILLATLFAVLVLANLAVFAFRLNPAPPTGLTTEERLKALEAEVAALKAEKASPKGDPMSRYRAVYKDGQFIGFKEGNPLIKSITIGGYSERPVSP